ncbi:hypothetical protein HGB38_08220 [Nocardia gamkensis]|uniref:Uncharacterized protein n=2 Tax=Nocardia gamkensis TaxID=352869 RepID=A0A7X6R2C3_9NOCA|nr:hypothetical protein [Nocardia gamkensis]
MVSTALVVAIAAPSATAQPNGPERTETAVASSSPITTVAESVVTLRIPLPESVGPHPAACDRLSYLRYRDAAGPARSAEADAVLVAQPGIFEGAGAFDSVARNTVAAAAKQGRHLEFWALDRRSNCLEDHLGMRSGLASRDVHLAIDYYYRGADIDGRRFGGVVPNEQLGWLGRVGVAQTVQDQYDLLTAELPDPASRKRKTLCGGHSLGGVLTGFFAEWDFGGVAGADQCAGYFALDSSIDTSLSALNGVPDIIDLSVGGIGSAAAEAALDGGVIPRVLALPAVINPETMNLLGIAGLAAYLAPDTESDLATYVPSSLNQEATYRVLVSRNVAAAATGSPSVRDFRITNAAALGAFLDANSQPLALLQAGFGFFDGGTVVDKDFPLPGDVAAVPALRGLTGMLFGPDRKAIPDQPNGPLYTWRDYDDPAVAAGAADRHGVPFTDATHEVTDIADLSRSLAAQPLDFTEWYFPMRLAFDVFQSQAPELTRHRTHPGGIFANPTINLIGGAGVVVAAGARGHGETVTAPGYHHIDVLTAAARQSGGQPEIISTNLARFALERVDRP